ncbi:methyl-accepting chemotaxis protein [Alicyclobacillus macrosporangiidus]|uniref:methyl-accepting chemotaxis protein n=1 Tax=Alicyclobacillus macrosporangiidus TaxID=392015 RepID=UPI000494ED2F|nr:methyl-accepting chemotaxis protein [Alicyclobacillus macrosporangiidus]
MGKLHLRDWISSLRFKLLVLSLALLVIPSLVLGLVSYTVTQNQLEAAGKEQLRQTVQHVLALIDEANGQVTSGQMTLEAAQEKVKQEVLGPKDAKGHRPINPRFAIGKNGYVIAINDHALSLMNPTVEGKDNWNQKTADGVYSGREMVKLAQNGGGYLTYMWPLPNSDQLAKKIVYVQKDPVWGWNVAAGTYLSDFNAPANEVLRSLLWVIVAEVILGSVVSLWIAHRISKPVSRLTAQVERVAAGDLTVEPEITSGRDEIARLQRGFANMMDALRTLIRSVGEAAEQLAASAEELSASAEENMRATEQVTQTAQEVAAGAERQVTAVHGGHDTVNQVASAMDRIAGSAEEASRSAATAAQASADGNASLEVVQQRMSVIQEKMDQLAAVVMGLEQRSEEIGKIVEVITDIAEQTNLLALNAAIEAARAGENGRSFAVVADEVRKLADHAATSAQQIRELITRIQDESQAAVASMRESTEEVASGLQATEDAGASFDAIAEAVATVSQQIQQVSVSAHRLADHAAELRDVMGQVAQVTEQTNAGMQTVSAATEEQLASMEEIAASAQSLTQMAEQLQSLLAPFRV